MMFVFVISVIAAWNPYLGNYNFPVTGSKDTQHTFNTGILASWNFEQDEARTVFESCTSETAMCTWGLSYAHGPFLNHPILSSADLGTARKYSLQAVEQANHQSLSDLEADLINATSIRYTDNQNTQSNGYEAYAQAMSDLYTKYPQNHDIAALYAESLMDLQCDDDGYHFYDRNGNALGRTNEIGELLRSILDDISHPFAHHLYIHLIEASKLGKDGTERAYSSGVALEKDFNLTDAQHLQHMPAHIFLRSGHWYKIVEASVNAVNSDSTYIQNEAVPYGPGHNCVFLVYGACMSGMRELAVQYSLHEQDLITRDPTREDDPPYEQSWNTLLTTYVRFGMWDEILNYTKPAPVDAWIFPSILEAYAKGIAYLHKADDTSRIEKAREQLQEIKSLAPKVDRYLTGVTSQALDTLAGIISFASKDFDAAETFLRSAASAQIKWPYSEPPRWHYPSSNCLGQFLLKIGKFDDAEDVFRDEIQNRYLNNPYGLYGLVQAMKNLPRFKPDDYAIYVQMLNDAWSHADVGDLTSACLAIEVKFV